MLALIVLMIFGLGTAYFATQNTGAVNIVLGSYLARGIPLYIIVVGSILLGVFIGWLVNLVDSFSSTRIINSKDSALKKAGQTIDELRNKNRNLETENASLKGKISGVSEPVKIREENINPRPSFFSRVRHSFS